MVGAWAARLVRAQLSPGWALVRTSWPESFSPSLRVRRGQGLCLSMPLLLMPCPHLIGFPHNWDEIIHGSAQETATTVVILLRFNLTESHLGALWRIKQDFFFQFKGCGGRRGRKEKTNLGFFHEPQTPLCRMLTAEVPWIGSQGWRSGSCHKCLGRRVAAGASRVTQAVYGRAAGQTRINISTVCSLLSSCGEGRQSHVTGRGAPRQPERSSRQQEGGQWKGSQTLSYQMEASPPTPPPSSSLAST